MFLVMMIADKYPELSEFLNELTVTIPNEQHPEITVAILESYHNSLSSLISHYKPNDITLLKMS